MSTPTTVAATVDPARAAESNLSRILVPVIVVHAIALAIGLSRFYVRVFMLKASGKDDLMMAACILCALAGLVCFILQGNVGLGRHSDTISTADMRTFNQLAFYQSLISAMGALGLLKISISFSLLRLSTGFVVVYTILAWLTLLLQCQPVRGFWDKSINPKCYDFLLFIKFGIANTAFNIFTDVCYATLPISVVMKLQIKVRTRVYLGIILSLGYFAVALGIVKAWYQIGFSSDTDKTFNQYIQFYGFLQLNVGIIAACTPTLKPMVGKALKLTTYGAYGNYNNISRSANAARAMGQSGVGRNRAGAETDLELHQGPFNNTSKAYRASIRGGLAVAGPSGFPPALGNDGERSGSEEYILQGIRPDVAKGAIVRTTSITIHNK